MTLYEFHRQLAWFLVLSLMVTNIISQVDRFAMTLLVAPMQKDLGLNDTQTGLIGGLVTGLFFAAAGMPLARLADLWGDGRPAQRPLV